MFIKNGSFKKYTHIISYVPPTIITQPVGGTKNVGSSHKFTISAKGSRPLTYQWFKTNSPILNETSNELNLTNLQTTDDANYYCEVRNNGYLITSNTVKLNVLIDISFVTQPTSVRVNKNSNISFTTSAVGTPPITYKWYKNSSIYPGTSNTIFINNVTKSEEGNYFAIASNLLTSITSNTARLSVNEGIVIVDQPDDTSLNVNNNLTLSLSCVGTFPISAQWRKDNTNYGSLSVTNTGDVKLQISNAQYTDEGNYDCVLSNVVGSVTSNKALLYINRPPIFTLHPVGGIGNIGGSFTFISNAAGTNPISYKWIKENVGSINGATLKNYTLNNLTFSNSGNYACVASNLYGTVTSAFASLTVEKTWQQIGDVIYGKTSSGMFGWSTSLNSKGDIVAIGARVFDFKQVEVYFWNETNWIQLGEFEDSGYSFVDVSLNGDGDILAIGYSADGESGEVKVYSWDGTNWSKIGDSIIGPYGWYAMFGYSVSLNKLGNKLVVGSNTNKTKVYYWDNTSWTQLGEDIIGKSDSNLGISVSINSDGNRIVLGDNNYVRIYDWDGNVWSQLGEDINVMGHSVSINNIGDKIIAGGTNIYSQRHSSAWSWDGSSWIKMGNNLAGGSVSMNGSGDKIITGDTEVSANSYVFYPGSARIYSWDGTDWTQMYQTITGKDNGDKFGFSVSINDIGNVVATGAIGTIGTYNGTATGYVRILSS